MRVTRKFRGQSLLKVGTEERNVYINQMSPATEKWYNGTDEELYVNEDTGELFLFCYNNVCEGNFICSFANFDELDEFAKEHLADTTPLALQII